MNPVKNVFVAPRAGDIDYDLEFYRPERRDAAIRPISIGMVRWDGLNYYAIDMNFPWEEIESDPDRFVFDKVLSNLPLKNGKLDTSHPDVKSRKQIREELLGFMWPAIRYGMRLWADAGAYDHVALMSLVDNDRGLMGKPDWMPYYTNDLRQEMTRMGVDEDRLPKLGEGMKHNPLTDARHLRTQREWIAQNA